jgi:nitroreductase
MSSNGRLTVPDKRAVTEHDIIDVLAERWSPRAFADRPVEPEKLRQLFEAARWAASSYNEQPWRYLVATKDDTEAYERLLDCLGEFNQKWAKTAPVLLLGFYKKTFSRNGKHNRCASHDLGAASAQLTAQATALDLYVHQMAGIRKEVIQKTYDIPDDFEPMAALAVGYLGDPDRLPEKLAKRERNERARRPLSDTVFGNAWGETADVVRTE